MLAAPNVHQGCKTLSLCEGLSKGRLTQSSPHSEGTIIIPPSRRGDGGSERLSHTAFTAESGSELGPSGSVMETTSLPWALCGPASVHLSALPVAGTGLPGRCSVSVCRTEDRWPDTLLVGNTVNHRGRRLSRGGGWRLTNSPASSLMPLGPKAPHSASEGYSRVEPVALQTGEGEEGPAGFLRGIPQRSCWRKEGGG